MGLLLTSTQHDHGCTYLADVARLDLDELADVLADIDAICHSRLDDDGIELAGRVVRHYAEVRYTGQTHGIEVELPAELGAETAGLLAVSFNRAHQQLHHHARPEENTEIMAVRTVHTYAWPGISDDWVGRGGGGNGPQPGRKPAPWAMRTATFDGQTTVELPVYKRLELDVDAEIEGPAIIDQMDSTTVVYPDQSARVDALGNLILSTA